MTPAHADARVSRWWAVAAAIILIAALWWTRPAPTSHDVAATSPTATPGAAATAAAAPDAPPAPALPAVALTLRPVVTGGGAPSVAVVPRGTAQVTLRLVGDLPAAVDLTAEITALDRDEIKRWPVDDAAPDSDGAARAVVVPPYAVPPGDFALTLWAGDADVVQRYAFRIVDR